MGLPTMTEALVISLLCELGTRTTLYLPHGTQRSSLVDHTYFSYGHWPASSVDRHNSGCRVGGPLSLLHDLFLVAPSLDITQIAGRKVVVAARTLGMLE
jgi:hypothetical protein